MNKVKRNLDNQAIGLVPLLLFMFLDNYFSYLLSFIIGVTFCFVCIFLFQILSKDKVYQFLLLPEYFSGLAASIARLSRRRHRQPEIGRAHVCSKRWKAIDL